MVGITVDPDLEFTTEKSTPPTSGPVGYNIFAVISGMIGLGIFLLIVLIVILIVVVEVSKHKSNCEQ